MGRILWWFFGILLYVVPRRRPDTSWKNDIWYGIFVRSFRNARGGPWGDLCGIIEKLDYLESLDIKVIWLGPIYDSPQLDGGYDVRNMFKIDPRYGTVEDLKELIRGAHKRGMRVVMDLPLNHASVQAEIIRAAMDPTHPLHRRCRKLLLWSKDGKAYPDACNAFPDETENWTYCEPVGKYYMHTFYPHQADLNFRNPRVWILILRVIAFWFRLGVDGFRLDAIRHIVKREGTNCQGLRETHILLGWLRWWVDRYFPGKILIGEAYEPPEKLVKYAGTDRVPECHMLYGFRYMNGATESNTFKSAVPFYDALDDTNAAFERAPRDFSLLIYDGAHDDLSEEHRDRIVRHMVQRTWAAKHPGRYFEWGIVARRDALGDGDRQTWEANSVVTHLFGKSALIYYMTELKGRDKPSLPGRDGLRLLMPWEPYRYAGFSKEEEGLAYPGLPDDYRRHNVSNQEYDPDSPLNWTRRLVACWRRFRAVLAFAPTVSVGCTEPDSVFAFARPLDGEAVVVVRNCTGERLRVELDLGRWQGWRATNLTPSLERMPAQQLGPLERPMLARWLGPQDYLILHLRRAVDC